MDSTDAASLPLVTRSGRSFRIARHPLAEVAAEEFCSGFEEGTLRFFDAVLPTCARMVDFGAYVGFTALYAATFVDTVFAFEPSPLNHELLARNISVNPELAARIHLFRHGLGARDETVPLYAKGVADSGASVFRDIERGSVVSAAPEADVAVRNAADVLGEIGLDDRTLLKIDIEGAEYAVLPAIAALLAEHRPWLHVSFHPFNLVAGSDHYHNAIRRLRCTFHAAEVLAPYRFMHLFSDGEWHTVGSAERMDFLRQYLLRAKPVPRVATPQYGFVHGVAFSDRALPAGA